MSSIVALFHCHRCIDEHMPPGLSVGFTADGRVQVWCNVHDMPVGPALELVEPPVLTHLFCQGCGKRFAQRGHHHASE